jgi:NAD(P)-dependent dehydrogenase (short-subunit alcohol dehydrogenase family)
MGATLRGMKTNDESRRNSDMAAQRTALVTGANSGVGLETAYKLSATGWGRVVLACRTIERAEAARTLLVARGVADVFAPLAVDLSEVKPSSRAAEKLLAQTHKLDLLVLNAGTAGGSVVARNSGGMDQTFASTLLGHHALAMRLLNGGGISENGRILIAASEASRGDVLGMTIPDFDAIARADFAGSVHDMLKAFAMASYPPKYVASTAYAIAKLWAAWWAAELAARLPKGVAIYAVSPGNTPSTNMGRDLPWPVRKIVFPILSAVGPFAGLAHSAATASDRYLEASRFGIGQSGKFFASPARKLTGPLVEQRTKWLVDAAKQRVAYELLVELTGGLDCG